MERIPDVARLLPKGRGIRRLGALEMANKVAEALKDYKIIMLRGHGSFATGQTLDEAFHWSSTLEESCQMELAAKLINEPFIEYRGMSGSYTQF
jgi:L-fuculose-phosphate aldolase